MIPMPDSAGIKSILREGREDDLVGLVETEVLDFKEQPYALHGQTNGAHRHHAWELAKDVAAMANGQSGGCIVIGIRTEPHPTNSEDVADEVKPFPCDLLDQQQYTDVVAKFVHPVVRGIEVLKFESDGRCLALIVIPPQDEDDGPFLLNKVVDPDGKRIEGFAMPVRDGSHTRWQPVGMIHRDIADGRRSRRAASTSTGDPAVARQTHSPLASRIATDLNEIEDFMGWHDSAIYALAAAPVSPPDRIDNFYGGDLRQRFASPFPLRGAGFGFGYSDQLVPGHGGLVAVDADSRYRRLEPNGYLVVALKADEDILGRTGRRSSRVARPLQINVVALVEFTYEFCRFQTTVLGPEIRSAWELALIVRGARSRPWSLRLRLPWNKMDLSRPQAYGNEAQSDEWLQMIDANEDHAANAYQLLARVCDLFEQAESDLAPFVKDGRVDEEFLKRL